MGLFGTVDSYDNKGPVGGATNPLTGAALARDRENQRAILELDGTQAYENITILDGLISPKRAEIIVDTEDGASADTLETILTNTDGSTTLHDGMKLTLRSADPSRSVTVKHSNSEFGIQMVDGQDVILGTKWGLKLKLVANKWFEDQGRIDQATTTSRGIGKVATLADLGPDAVIENGPAFLAAGSDAVTPTPTPNTIMRRDEAGRVQAENPVLDKDVANKGYVDNMRDEPGKAVLPGTVLAFTGEFGGSDGKRPINSYTGQADEGWVLCDGGTYQAKSDTPMLPTPDLRNRFLMGAPGGTGGTYGGSLEHTHAVTVAPHTLTVAQMPSHAHNIYTSDGGILASGVSTSGAKTLPVMSGYLEASGGSQAHTHGASSDAASSLPPYYALAYIMKL